MVSMASPSHSLPPLLGTGLVHKRLRLNRPPSQVKEQDSNSAHSLQPPSIGRIIRRNTAKVGFEPKILLTRTEVFITKKLEINILDLESSEK
jgi:hypothetical protein